MTATFTLEQKQLFRGRQTYVLLPSGELRVATKDAGGTQEFSIELKNLSPKTVRIAKTAGAPLFGVILFGILYIGMVVSLFIGLRNDPQPILSASFISGMIGIIMIPLIITCFARWRRMKCDVTAFSNRWTGEFAVGISNTGADPAKTAEFIAELTRRIEQAETVPAHGDGIADQVARLHELQVKGILSADEFAAAKQRILTGQLVEKKIGF
ncbi:MAG TPA: SHOCT domain-containing protein [Chthoniobacteraceae bacterium]|jgi:hypothetical protein|nr:SHOCT domain-containing protein [Chthoniobacteraceae bacterium]